MNPVMKDGDGLSSMISVIVPVYNVEKYLRQCVDSILAQTLTGMEVILVDDGSQDNCPAICDHYAVNDTRVKVIHKTNGGLGSARNAGLDAALGDYIAFIDSDDYIASDMFEKLLNAIQKEHADIALCGFQRVDENKNIIDKTNSRNYSVISGLQALNNLYTNDFVLFTIACNKLFKKELFATYRFPEGRLYEDGYAAFRYYYASENVVCVPDFLYFYLVRSGSITTQASTARISDGFRAEVDSMRFLAEKGCSELLIKAQTKYIAAIITSLRVLDLTQRDVLLRLKEVHVDFCSLYAGIMKNPVLSNKEKFLITVFRISPRLCKWVIKVNKL